MDDYIKELLVQLGHPPPSEPQKAPHKWRDIKYRERKQMASEEDKSPPLDAKGVKRVQQIVGALLYY